MTGTFNGYGDDFTPNQKGGGVDVSSQRQDDLDRASLTFIQDQIEKGRPVHALDLGGGFGVHALHMAQAGATVTLVDIETTQAKQNITQAIADRIIPGGRINIIETDFREIGPHVASFNLLYSQRAIHYIPYKDAQDVLHSLFNKMSNGGSVFISGNGYYTEYGETYPHRDLPVEKRFSKLTDEMQKKHGIYLPVVTYKEDEMAKLLQSAGFVVEKVYSSRFGNIKAIAHKL